MKKYDSLSCGGDLYLSALLMDGVRRQGGGRMRSISPYHSYRYAYSDGKLIAIPDKGTTDSARNMDTDVG